MTTPKSMEFFTLQELTGGREATAPLPVRESLVSLAVNVLDPWRRRVGRLRVSSGWRTDDDNKRVGGVKGSQHTTGEAVDVVPLDVPLARAWELLTGLPFDQAIVYPKDGHIHVSHVGQVSARRQNRGARYRSPGAAGVKYERL